MVVLALTAKLHCPASQSLKQRRAATRPIIEGARQRFSVSVAEVGGQDTWQRCDIGIALVSGEARVAEQLADEIERFIWSFPDVTVLSVDRQWMELDA